MLIKNPPSLPCSYYRQIHSSAATTDSSAAPADSSAAAAVCGGLGTEANLEPQWKQKAAGNFVIGSRMR